MQIIPETDGMHNARNTSAEWVRCHQGCESGGACTCANTRLWHRVTGVILVNYERTQDGKRLYSVSRSHTRAMERGYTVYLDLTREQEKENTIVQ